MSDSQEIETTPETAPETAPSEGTQPSETAPSNPPAEATAGSEPTIPYSRFREVNEQKKALQLELERARSQPQYQQPIPSYMQPQGEKAPTQDQFNSYEDFLSATAAHTAKQAARMEFQVLQRQQSEAQGFQQQQTRVVGAYQNWSSKIADVTVKDPTFQARAMDLLGDLPSEVGLMIMGDPATKELTTHFVNHPEDALRLRGLNPYQAAREVGALSAKLATAPAKMVSKMPTPMAPVGTGKTGSKRPDDMSVNDVVGRLYPMK